MATQTATIINLVNTVLGAGMLALPFAFRAQGIALTLASLLFGAATTGLGLMLLAYASGFLPAGSASFFQVAKITYPSLAVVFDVAIGLKCFGVCVSYLVIVGDLMPMVTAYFGWATARALWLAVAMAIVAPLSFYRNLDSLKTASIIALSSVVYLVVIVVGHFLRGDTLDQKGPVAVWRPKGAVSVISTVPIIVFAFTCAQNMFSAVNELERRTVGTLLRITAATVSISAAVYAVVGLAGYLSFGDNVGDNVISMYAQSVWSTLGRFAIVVLVLFSYPLMCHPARGSVTNIIEAVRGHKSVDGYVATSEDADAHAPLLPVSHTGDEATGGGHGRNSGNIRNEGRNANNPGNANNAVNNAETNAASNDGSVGATKDQNRQREHMVVTSLILVMSYVLASTLNSLELILSFVGATGATAVSFILPGVFGFALASTSQHNSLIELTAGQKKLMKYSSALLFLWGCVVAVLAVGVNIYRIVRH